jgi:rubrerythrin
MEHKLLNLFARLSRDAERSKVYAMRAEKDGRPELAGLFMSLAASRAMQARRFLMQLRGAISSTDENEKYVYEKELPASIEEYRQLLADAEEEGIKGLATGFRHSSAVEQRNLELYSLLRNNPQDTQYHVCDFCGYVAMDVPPDSCPVCSAPKIRFKKIDAL